ncbi:MAG: undecaprenyl-diphosphate phosphatase [Candidatus Zixiibacteriota bacterium]
MGIIEAIVLGVIQGLTEFLPISSSGHLVLAQRLLSLAPGDLSFEVAVHGGTLLAVIAYFWPRVQSLAKSVFGQTPDTARRDLDLRLVFHIVIGTIPAVVLGLAFKDHIEELFASPVATSIALIVTGIWLLLMRVVRSTPRELSKGRAVIVGLAQAAAIVPGISRSGATIATGAMLGVRAREAAEFSFLLSVPAIFGANLLAIPEAMTFGRFGLMHVVGAVAAAIVGYVSIRWVFAAIRHGNFQWFGLYCLIVGTVSTILLV